MNRIVFLALLPLLLIAWAAAASANVSVHAYGNPVIGCAFVILACVLFSTGIRQAPRKKAEFHWVPYPIHIGAIVLSIGVSMIAQSAAGLWLITPIVAFGCVALIAGSATHFAILPPDNDERPTTRDGIRFLCTVVIPWLAIFEFTSHMGLHGTPFHFAFENQLPVYPWTAIVYETSYLTVTFAPTWTHTNRQLRQLMLTSWAAILIVYPIYWFMPSAAPRRPMVNNSWIAHLLMRERTGVAPTAAFPSFHVLWAIFVGRLWPRWIGVGYAVVIAASCISTGMHFIPDVLAAFAISPLLLEPERRIWNPMVKLTAWISKAVNDWPVASMALATFVTVAIGSAAAGPGREWHVAVAACAGLAVAFLMRSRGLAFIGGWIGVALACAFFEERWILLGAYTICAPFLQAPGRVRTALFLADIFLGLVAVRLWTSTCPLSVTCGIYVIGTGIILLAEGRKWIAAAAIVVGAVLTAIPSSASPPLMLTAPGLWIAFGAAVAAAVVARNAA